MPVINTPELKAPLTEKTGVAGRGFSAWLMQVFRICFDVQNSGTTADRPSTNLYTGKPYFDTTLGIPIWFKTAGWVNSAGAPV